VDYKEGLIKKSVITCDPHVPFHDKLLWKNILNFCKDLKLTSIDEFIIGGDGIDFFTISPFLKIINSQIDPENVQYERTSFLEFLRDLRKVCKKAKIIFIEGNHEARWDKFLSSDAKQLSRIPELEIKNFLGINKYNIKYVQEYKPNLDFLIKHGESISKHPSQIEIDKEICSGVSGHSHRTDRAYRRGHDKKYRWYSLGHTADKNQIDKNCKFSRPLKWDQSIGLLITDFKNNEWDMEVMHCDNNGFYSKFLRKKYL